MMQADYKQRTAGDKGCSSRLHDTPHMRSSPNCLRAVISASIQWTAMWFIQGDTRSLKYGTDDGHPAIASDVSSLTALTSCRMPSV